MKKIVVACYLILLIITYKLPAQTWNWTQSIGGTQSDKVITTKVTPTGDVVVSGYFSENMSLGNGVNITKISPSGNSKDIFVAKYNAAGVCQWGVSGGDYFDDRILGMDVDLSGNIYITGTCWGTITLGGVTLSAGPNACCDQCFVYKLSPTGAVVWGNMAGGTGDDQGLDLIVDDQANVYIGGFMNSGNTMELGTTMTVTGANTGSHVYNYWVGKLNAAGTWQWASTFGNLPWDPTIPVPKYVERDIALSLDDSSNIYVTGGFDGSRKFGNFTLTSQGGHDVFVLKMKPNGTIAWAKSGGSKEDDWSNSVAADSMGHVYITGEHRDSMYFGTELIKNYKKRDVFVAKFDALNGDCLWGKRAGGDDGGERGNDIFANKSCDVYLVGEIGRKGKFGPIVTDSVGAPHLFVARIEPDGSWVWVTTAGTIDSADCRANSICPGPNKTLYVAGNYRGFSNFGAQSYTSLGKTDGFLARLTDNSPSIVCNPFPIPFVNAGVLSIQSPIDTICANKITPQFTLTNIGNLLLTSATIEYTIDGGSPISYNWTGGLDSMDTELVYLPLSTIVSGNHSITITITMANGFTDTYVTNNALTSNFYVTPIVAQALPFIEGFESATFPANNITIQNPDLGITWEETNLAYYLGVKSARVRNFNNNTIGAIDELQLPALDFNNINYPKLSFDYAYSCFTQGATDTLQILISVDCGETYQTIAKLFGATLQTTAATTTAFVPTIEQWKHLQFNLNQYGDNPYARIIFRNISGYENNLYIDNINVIGTPTSIENQSTSSSIISVFPNPATDNIQVTYDATKDNSNISIEMFDMAGRILKTWKESANLGTNKWELDLPKCATGVYLLKISNEKESFTQRLMIE